MEKAIVSRSGSAVFVDGGDSPLAKRKKTKLLTERLIALFAKAEILKIDCATLGQWINRRNLQTTNDRTGSME